MNLKEQLDQFLSKVPNATVEQFMHSEEWYRSRGLTERQPAHIITIKDWRLPDHWYTRFITAYMLLEPFFPNQHLQFWLSARPQPKALDRKTMDLDPHRRIARLDEPGFLNLPLRETRIEGYTVPHHRAYPEPPLYQVSIILPRDVRVDTRAYTVMTYYRHLVQFFTDQGSDAYHRNVGVSADD